MGTFTLSRGKLSSCQYASSFCFCCLVLGKFVQQATPSGSLEGASQQCLTPKQYHSELCNSAALISTPKNRTGFSRAGTASSCPFRCVISLLSQSIHRYGSASDSVQFQCKSDDTIDHVKGDDVSRLETRFVRCPASKYKHFPISIY